MEFLPPSDGRPATMAELIGPPMPLTRPEQANTPGVLGYFLALVIADAVAATLLGVGMAIDSREPTALSTIPFLALWALVLAGLPAVPVMVAVHFLLRRVPGQGIHVLAFAVVGATTAGVVFGPLLGELAPPVMVDAAIGAAVGRWSVSRLIRGRRPAVMSG